MGNSRGRFRLALTLLAAIFLGALPAGLASPAFAAATGTISGTVTVPAGVDVTTVAVQTFGGPSYSRVQVNPNGSFALTGLGAGQYKVGFSQYPEGTLASSWYGSYAEIQATLVPVAAGTTVTGINQAMHLSGSIAGKVTVPAGVDASKITVSAGPEVGNYRTANPASDGTFTVAGLQPGDAWVNFSYLDSPAPVVAAYYSTVPDGTKTLVAVTEGATTGGINQTLKPAAIISGNISVPGGSPAFTGQVTVAGGPDYTLTNVVGSAWISADKLGNYAIGGLAPGVYKLHFASYSDNVANMWHGGAAVAGSSPSISLSAGQQLAGVRDAAVGAASITGSISGAPAPGPTMTGPGMSITAVLQDGSVAASTVMQTSQSTYALKNLLPGTYRIQFNRTPGFVSSYEAQLYRDLPESGGLANAAPLAVLAGQTVTNINATVHLGGTLTGKVLGASSAPLANARINVYTKNGSLVSRFADTASDGTFRVTGLSSGLYFVSATPADGSGLIFSGNVVTEANARSVAEAVGQNTDIGTLSYASAGQGKQGFDDVPLGAQFQNEIQWLADKGISTGWQAGDGSRTYQPLTPVNRDAMAAFMYRLSGKPAFTAPTIPTFKDVPAEALFFKEITWLADKGISTGWEEADKTRTYRPLQPVNRDAMAAFMYRLAGEPDFTAPQDSPFTDLPTTAQFYKEITWLAAQGISTGWAEVGNTKSFRPLQPVNRDAMAAFMFRYNAKFGSI
ncbi:S-layer homology domain-containing protein [Arthrobacter sp. efr-133-TYG-104]|uniref:S-layer homology domain-containing protein n=1 Tax=Arthrobacter sp. efr-133-TYG-104 TaxID=3040324 RepID=UPI00254ABB78|nr:S-layer homology domain-containing protein [Arthrobacter sp. efr-133-TYG-104]